jgi:hypothetical protein
VNPEISLAQVRRILGAVSVLGFVIVGIVSRFDPSTAVWIAWGVSFIVLFDGGLYLHDLLPSYQAGAWLFLILIWFVGFLYVKQLAENLACPAVEYRGKLIASALPSPDNPCLKMHEYWMNAMPRAHMKPIPPNTVFLFLGSNVSYVSERGHWPVIYDKGQILMTQDLDEKGLSVSTRLYDEQGNVQAIVDDNDVNALSPDICVKRPDLSTLVISDRSTKEERLYVHYVNPQAVELRGSFLSPNLTPVTIAEKEIRIGDGTIKGSCLPEASMGSIVIP